MLIRSRHLSQWEGPYCWLRANKSSLCQWCAEHERGIQIFLSLPDAEQVSPSYHMNMHWINWGIPLLISGYGISHYLASLSPLALCHSNYPNSIANTPWDDVHLLAWKPVLRMIYIWWCACLWHRRVVVHWRWMVPLLYWNDVMVNRVPICSLVYWHHWLVYYSKCHQVRFSATILRPHISSVSDWALTKLCAIFCQEQRKQTQGLHH